MDGTADKKKMKINLYKSKTCFFLTYALNSPQGDTNLFNLQNNEVAELQQFQVESTADPFWKLPS